MHRKRCKKIFGATSEKMLVYETVSHNELLKIYKISDLIIIPSLQEWSSLMMSEVVSLNKPVFAFKTGSSEDLIQNNVNGLIFDDFDYNNIALNIAYYLKKNKFMNQNALDKDNQINNKINLKFIEKQLIERVFND